jgi:hypothetical protein
MTCLRGEAIEFQIKDVDLQIKDIDARPLDLTADSDARLRRLNEARLTCHDFNIYGVLSNWNCLIWFLLEITVSFP